MSGVIHTAGLAHYMLQKMLGGGVCGGVCADGVEQHWIENIETDCLLGIATFISLYINDVTYYSDSKSNMCLRNYVYILSEVQHLKLQCVRPGIQSEDQNQFFTFKVRTF